MVLDPAGGGDLRAARRAGDLGRGRLPRTFGVLNAILVGTGVGLFEEFYVQSLRGRWFRNVHPLLSIAIYTFIVAILFVIATNITHLLLHPFYPVARAVAPAAVSFCRSSSRFR